MFYNINRYLMGIKQEHLWLERPERADVMTLLSECQTEIKYDKKGFKKEQYHGFATNKGMVPIALSFFEYAFKKDLNCHVAQVKIHYGMQEADGSYKWSAPDGYTIQYNETQWKEEAQKAKENIITHSDE